MTKSNGTAPTVGAVAEPVSKYTDLYVPKKHRTRDVEYLLDNHEDGDTPVMVTLRCDLTFREIDALPSGSGHTWKEIFASIAPYVLDWNVTGRNLDTDEYERLPAPADVGPDIFQAADPQIAAMVLASLKQIHIGDGGIERKKSSTGSAHTPEPSDGSN